MTWTINQQLALTATEAVAAIQAGRLLATAYIATLLERAAVLSTLNAFTALNGDRALDDASRIDALPAHEKARFPLAGLPIVVKDNINTRGLLTSAGTPALDTFIPATNAPSVQRLLDAGAIIIGKTNMHELALGITSTNLSPHAGPVRNPYDLGLIAGGSSGGTAAAIAARIVPAGLGTDTGGSTRIPAALTGIAGVRPSVGNGGSERRYHNPNAVVPISHTRDTVGPMARTVADVALLDGVMTGDAGLPTVGLIDLRIGLPTELWEGLDTAVERVAREALARLEAAGVTLVNVGMPDLLPLSAKISFPLALHEPIDDLLAWLIANNAPVKTIAEVAAQIASPDVQQAYASVIADEYGDQYQAAMTTWRPQLQQHYAMTFVAQRLDALLFPTTLLAAVPHDEINGSSTVSINGDAPVDEMQTYLRNTDPGSIAGIPGLSLPAGVTAQGLPVGIELDGPTGSDRRLLAIGAAFERVLGSLAAPPL